MPTGAHSNKLVPITVKCGSSSAVHYLYVDSQSTIGELKSYLATSFNDPDVTAVCDLTVSRALFRVNPRCFTLTAVAVAVV